MNIRFLAIKHDIRQIFAFRNQIMQTAVNILFIQTKRRMYYEMLFHSTYLQIIYVKDSNIVDSALEYY